MKTSLPALLCLALALAAIFGGASSARAGSVSIRPVCGVVPIGYARCFSLVKGNATAAGPSGYGPADLPRGTPDVARPERRRTPRPHRRPRALQRGGRRDPGAPRRPRRRPLAPARPPLPPPRRRDLAHAHLAAPPETPPVPPPSPV